MTEKDQNENSMDDGSSSDEDLGNLSLDEKAAFEKIMAEIEKNQPPAAGPPQAAAGPDPKASPAPDGGEDSAQHDLVNQIMAEIGSADGSDAPGEKIESTGEKPPASGKDDLSSDQQDALSKIMAEIEAKKNKNVPEETEEAAPETSTSTPASPAGDPDAGDDDEPSPKKPRSSLSMEEFNSELTQLISSVSATAAPQEHSNQAPPAPVTGPDSTPAMHQVGAESASLKADTGASAEAGGVPSDGALPGPDADGGVPSEDAEDSEAHSGAARLRTAKKKSRKAPLRAFAAVVAILALTGGYWGYRHLRGWSLLPAAIHRRGEALPVKPTPTPAPAAGPSQPAPKPAIEKAPVEPVGSVKQRQLESLQADLDSAQQVLQRKIAELQDLKEYYQKGIDEEMDKLAATMRSARATTLEGALKLEHIELGLRSMQRRYAYILKLGTPLKQLDAAVEDLLYQQRRARLIKYLDKNISGLPTESFAADAAEAVKAHLSESARLSIDGIDAQVPSLEQIWQQLEERLKSGAVRGRPQAQTSSQDRAIAAEICNGRFERKDLLTVLDVDTARCLLKWSGKDLFLNGVTSLSLQAAEILARWPGEWLSLNGLQELPAPLAERLSHWTGKRLSLNGLHELGPEATASMSGWQGEQLEMIGLRKIGRWENYSTRLFLSEDLKRRLEAQ